MPVFDVPAAGGGVAFTYPADDAHNRDTIFVEVNILTATK
jgi:hypothetical protein